MHRYFNLAFVFLFTCMLNACGGGGGGAAAGGSGGSWLSFSPTSMSSTTSEGAGTSVSITATSNRTIAQVLYGRIEDSGEVYDPTAVSITPISALQYRATFRPRTNLPVGTYNGQLLLKLCLDLPTVCANQIDGSPWTIPYTHVVNPLPIPINDVSVVTAATIQSVVSAPNSAANAVVVRSPTVGGALGRDFSPKTLTFALSVASRTAQWSLTPSPSVVKLASHTLQVIDNKVSLSFAPNNSVPGFYSESFLLTAKHSGGESTKTIVISSAVDEHRLTALEPAIALSDTPTGQRVSHSIQLKDNFGQATNWTASSSQAWLAVTPSGRTDAGGIGTLTVSANTAALPSNTLSYAQITINATGLAADTVSVAVWKSSDSLITSTTVMQTETRYSMGVVDPLRPFVYALSNNKVDTFNLYTKQRIGSVNAPSAPNIIGALLAVSPQGDMLHMFVPNTGTLWSSKLPELATWESKTLATGDVALAQSLGERMLILRVGNRDILHFASGLAYTLSPWGKALDPSMASLSNLRPMIVSASANSQYVGWTRLNLTGGPARVCNTDWAAFGYSVSQCTIASDSNLRTIEELSIGNDRTIYQTIDRADACIRYQAPTGQVTLSSGRLPSSDRSVQVLLGAGGKLYCVMSDFSVGKVATYNSAGVLTGNPMAFDQLLGNKLLISSDGLLLTYTKSLGSSGTVFGVGVLKAP